MSLLLFFVLYDLSGPTVWTALYVKRCRRIWRRRSAIKMGQMLKDFGEKRENNICLEMGRNNKVATGGSPSARRLLISYPHPITLPKVGICSPAWQGSNYAGQVISKNGCVPPIHKVTAGHGVLLGNSSL